ncbi:hypothetical protein ABZ614_36195 [Streptomyces sp. NPDC013178]|uniref:hypothetical protein n=1 Tax=unclassified Streptomyces TaxID=2593676 RepID=UPI0033F2A6EC
MAAAPAARLEETLTDRGERDTRSLQVLVSNARRFDVAPTVTAVSTVLIALASSPSHWSLSFANSAATGTARTSSS